MAQVFRAEDGRVGFGELFFDLVFVFAITQISHHLLYHFTPAGALETGFLFLAVWWVWIYSTWAFNRLDPDNTAVRLLLFSLMAGGLFLSMAIPQAFGDRGAVFGIAFAAMQVGRSLFVLFAARGRVEVRRTYTRITIWLAFAGLFWVWGGFANPEARWLLWGLALGLELAGPVVSYWVPGLGRESSTNWAINGGHMAERCGLFVIICLGETLLISGATFADTVWDGPGLLAFFSTVLGAVAMWWVYFHIGHKRGTHLIEHSYDPGALGRLAYTYLHIPIVAGVVLGAVGSELTIAHPLHHSGWGEAAAILGGVALFLLGNGLFKWVSAPYFPLSHMVGIGLCCGLAVLTAFTNLVQLNLAAALVLVVVAVWEARSFASGRTSAEGQHGLE